MVISRNENQPRGTTHASIRILRFAHDLLHAVFRIQALVEIFRRPRLLEVCQNEAAAVAVGQHRPPGNRSIDYADGDQIFFRHEGEQKLPITVMSTRTDRTLEAYHAPNRVKTPRRLGNRSREKSYCIWNLTPKESATKRIPYYDRSVPDLQSSNYSRRRTDSTGLP